MPVDAAALEGTWQMIRAEFEGEAAPELVVRKTTLEFSGSAYAVRFDRDICDQGSYKIRVIGEQKTLSFSGVSGINAGRTIPAIFQIVGDRLRVCYGFDGALPTAFSTAIKFRLYLATYRRAARS